MTHVPSIERVDCPGQGILVRWQRVTPPFDLPACYLDIRHDRVDVWGRTNPIDDAGQSCTHAEFLAGALQSLAVNTLDRQTWEEARAWIERRSGEV